AHRIRIGPRESVVCRLAPSFTEALRVEQVERGRIFCIGESHEMDTITDRRLRDPVQHALAPLVRFDHDIDPIDPVEAGPPAVFRNSIGSFFSAAYAANVQPATGCDEWSDDCGTCNDGIILRSLRLARVVAWLQRCAGGYTESFFSNRSR